MTTYHLSLSQYKTQKRQKSIILSVCFTRTQRRTIPTGVHVLESQWDKANECVVRHPGAAALNILLAKQVKSIQELEISAIAAGEPFTYEYLAKVLPHTKKKPVTDPRKETCFNSYFFNAIKRQYRLQPQTQEDHYKTYKVFNAYAPGLLFKDFTYNTLAGFDKFCIERKLSDSTIWKHHKNIKKYLNLASKEGVYSYAPGKHPYDLFKAPRAQGNKTALSVSELDRLEKMELPAHLDKHRWMFLFLCYTGLRISDFMRLTPSLMEDDVLVIRPKKTEHSSSAEVHLPIKMLFGGKPYKIWEQFNFDFPCHAKGFELRFNICLKQIAMLAGISKKMSAHVGRHTFLTHIAAKTGNVFTVMSLGGIRKVDTAMVYVHLAEQDNTKSLSMIQW